ncbi:hypothetical protein NG798_23080 [Ancylothrix sp. C2]|uniref:hypothetical protein n=1 Tax=Ancylothrix sp. D3o TaxID=2953691 RepID=UPI0021BAB674|nr:hypothetical protein [Ancylothrix sp. D3o]MCT7952687.1 hypothetical protein [Ancylothrix sp. D3o]
MAWQDVQGIGNIPVVIENCESIAKRNNFPVESVEAYPLGSLPFSQYSRKYTQIVYRIVDMRTEMDVKKDGRLKDAIPHAYIIWYGGKPLNEQEFLDVVSKPLVSAAPKASEVFAQKLAETQSETTVQPPSPAPVPPPEMLTPPVLVPPPEMPTA